MLSHVLSGAGLGALIGTAGWLKHRESDGLVFAAAMVLGGAIVGVALYFTRAWSRKGHAADLARWAVAGAIGGVALCLSGLFDNEINARTLGLSAAMGALVVLFFGWDRQRDEYKETGVDARSGWSKALQWALALFVMGVVFTLMMLTPQSADGL